MPTYKKLSLRKPPEPWYHEPVQCHKLPKEFIVEAVTFKVMHLTKHEHDNFFTFTIKCDYGPYAYFAINRNYDANMDLVYALEANIGCYRYRRILSAEEFGDLSPDSTALNHLIICVYCELLKSLGHPLHYRGAGWKVEYDEAELRGF